MQWRDCTPSLFSFLLKKKEKSGKNKRRRPYLKCKCEESGKRMHDHDLRENPRISYECLWEGQINCEGSDEKSKNGKDKKDKREREREKRDRDKEKTIALKDHSFILCLILLFFLHSSSPFLSSSRPQFLSLFIGNCIFSTWLMILMVRSPAVACNRVTLNRRLWTAFCYVSCQWLYFLLLLLLLLLLDSSQVWKKCPPVIIIITAWDGPLSLFFSWSHSQSLSSRCRLSRDSVSNNQRNWREKRKQSVLFLALSFLSCLRLSSDNF